MIKYNKIGLPFKVGIEIPNYINNFLYYMCKKYKNIEIRYKSYHKDHWPSIGNFDENGIKWNKINIKNRLKILENNFSPDLIKIIFNNKQIFIKKFTINDINNGYYISELEVNELKKII